MTIVGTRPEIIKLCRVIDKLEKYFNHVLVHTGQNYDYELNEIFFKEMKIKKPDYFLNAVGKTTAETIGNVISESDKVFDIEKPDAILLYGDTNSCLSVISAKRRKIPVFHMEAGNRCFDQRVPEEINRKIVDHLSDINMTLTEHARRYLLNEGLPSDRVIKTGSSMPEVLMHYKVEINSSDVVEKLSLTEKDYFVLSTHREENIDSEKNFTKLVDTLNSIAENYGKRIIFSAHPRTVNKIAASNATLNSLIEIMKPLGFFDYIKLQKSAYCVISDSGTITEESGILKFPAITIREAHERPEGFDAGTLIMSGLDFENVKNSIRIVTEQSKASFSEDIYDYSSLNVSDKVIRIIQSYTEFVNRVVWSK